jgi:cytochrome oxidase Cu insertion factor (SCO1/SenC/PrrC family)
MKAWLALGALVASAGNLVAQAERPTPLPAGTVAPDFTLPSATRTGLGKPVSLRDFRGQVVVLAFFFRARTSG